MIPWKHRQFARKLLGPVLLSATIAEGVRLQLRWRAGYVTVVMSFQ